MKTGPRAEHRHGPDGVQMTGQDQQNLVLESWSRTVQKQRAQRLLIGLKIIDACGPINPLQQNKQHGEARAALVELERTRDDAIISASPEDLPGVLVHYGLSTDSEYAKELRSESTTTENKANLQLLQRPEVAEMRAQFEAEVQSRVQTGHMWEKLRIRINMISLLGTLDEAQTLRAAAGIDEPVVPWTDQCENAEQLAKDRSCFVHPSGRRKAVWDLYMLAVLCYVAAVVPLRLGFSISVDFAFSLEFVIDVIIDVSLIADVIINFCTGYYAALPDTYEATVKLPTTMLISDPRKIRNHYFRSWFAIDLASCLPVSYVTWLVGDKNGGNLSGLRPLKIVRLLRLTKMLRLAALKRYFELSLSRLHFQIEVLQATLLCLVGMSFVCHISACGWFYVGIPGHNGDPTWLDGNIDYSWSTDSSSTPSDMLIFHDSLFTQYRVAMYWATNTFLSIGYGDIFPVTAAEQDYTTLVCLVGGVINIFCAGSLFATIVRLALDPVTLEHRKLMIQSEHYMKTHQVPSDLRRRVRTDFVNRFYREKSVDEVRLLGEMRQDLALEVCQHVYGDVILKLSKSRLFEFVYDQTILNELVASLERWKFNRGDRVVSVGEQGHNIYIILSGACCRLHNRGLKRSVDKAELRLGDVFGDAAALGMGTGPDGRNERHTIEARKTTVLGVLTQEKLNVLCSKHPALREKLMRGFWRRHFISENLTYHFFLSHKQQNGGNAMQALKADLAARGLMSWYDNDQNPILSEMMAGVRASAVFLLFITDGVLEREFVQRELSQAFRLRKPIMLLIEQDSRFAQLDWLFMECNAIPLRRPKHERSAMLDKLEDNALKATAGVSSVAKRPPMKLSTLVPPSTEECNAIANERQVLQDKQFLLPSTQQLAPSNGLNGKDELSSSSLSSDSVDLEQLKAAHKAEIRNLNSEMNQKMDETREEMTRQMDELKTLLRNAI